MKLRLMQNLAQQPILFRDKIIFWLDRVEPERYENPELVSPFAEWPPPKPILLPSLPTQAPASTSLQLGQTVEDIRSGPRRSVKFVDPVWTRIKSIPSTELPLTPTPIRGDFIPATQPRRVPTPAPKNTRQKRDVHIHLSLSDSQLAQISTM